MERPIRVQVWATDKDGKTYLVMDTVKYDIFDRYRIDEKKEELLKEHPDWELREVKQFY